MMKIYNTLTIKKESFKPLNKKKVRLFVCGITPYGYAHIGHAKTYVQFDIIARYLKYKGYNIFYLQNVTDIDDKIIKRAKEQKKDPLSLAHEYEKYYHEDMQRLKVSSVDKYARATDYIKEIVSQVQRLIKLGYAYKIEDGYYFDLSKFPDYGNLSGRNSLEAEDSVSRIDESKEKKNKGDFCLWKFYKKGEPFWEIIIEKGRPGWHIEDTAITEKEFGPQYDIHGGARDLIFPHHEAEIAQMESLSKRKPFVKYWLHTGFLNVKSQKMSKSLGNFITIREILKKYPPETLRMLYGSTHYRSPIDFDEKSLEQAKANVENIKNFLLHAKNAITEKKENPKIKKLIEKLKKEFTQYMDDDFNAPKVFAALFIFINECNKLLEKGISKQDYESIEAIIEEINAVFDVIHKEEKIPKEIIQLAEEREKARKQKDWKTADKLREKMKEKGYLLEDTDTGYLIKRNQ